jgi:arylsulfatase A-like enzyme
VRRSIALAAGATLLLGGIVGTAAFLSASRTVGPRPNILLIVTDDQRYDTLDVMPAVRRWFVEAGTSFSSAYAVTPLCCPSRASMLTGQHLHNHGIDDNEEHVSTLRDVQRRTVQAALDRVGYRTGLFGKLFNNWPNDVDPAYFDRWATTPFVTYSGARWNVGGEERRIRQNSVRYLGDLFLDFASDGERRDRRPWFGLIGFMAPHMPVTLEAAYERIRVQPLEMTPGRREFDRSDKPWYVRKQPLKRTDLIQARRVPQLRSLVAVDDQIDRIMRRLQELGELDDTLVIFTSDNGLYWGEHGLFQKSAPYREAVHVPLLLRWPGHVQSGVLDERLVGILDIAPTILAAARARPPVLQDGVDLLAQAPRRARLLLEFRKLEGEDVPTWSAIITRTWVFVEYRGRDDEVIAREYYDFVRDPAQLVNMFKDGDPSNDPDTGLLHAQLRALMDCSGRECRP